MRSSPALRKADTRSTDACLQGVRVDLIQIDTVRISFIRLVALAWNDFISMNSGVSLHLQTREAVSHQITDCLSFQSTPNSLPSPPLFFVSWSPHPLLLGHCPSRHIEMRWPVSLTRPLLLHNTPNPRTRSVPTLCVLLEPRMEVMRAGEFYIA